MVRRCKEVLRETSNRVRIGEREGEIFWIVKEVRQGCPLSSSLFILLLADIDEVSEKGGWGGVKLGGRKIYTLAYADVADIAIMVEDEEGMKGIMGKLEKYLEEKGMELNVGKTKIMRCRKGRKIGWRWKGSRRSKRV